MKLFGMNFGVPGKGKDLPTVESEPTPTEARKPIEPAPSYGTEHDLCELVNRRAKEAAQNRRVAEREWTLGVAMYEDRQWLAWDETVHQAISLMQDDEIDRYVTHNLVRPLIDKLIGLSTMSKPDATPAPQSDSPLDRAAADEARVITAHLWRLHERPLQMLDATWWAGVCGLVYLREYWDPNAVAEVGVPGPDGNTARKVPATIGEVCSDIVPPFSILIDPRARRWKNARWIIHDEMLETATIEERFGVNVEPDAGLGNGGNWFDSFLPEGARFGGVSSLGPFASRSPETIRAARILTCYERPTPEYPEGRTIIATRDRLLYAGPMPLTDKQQFPFARLVYQEAAAHPYGLGLMRSLAPLQVGLNRLLTKAVNHIESAKDTLLDPKGSGVGADAYGDDIEEKRSFRRVKWDATNPGGPPTWQVSPPVTGDIWRMIDLTWMHMQHIAGIHDVNMGGTPTGITAGISIELLQQGDRTQLGLFTQRIEMFTVERDAIDIALYAQYAVGNLPRMMGLDDTGNPQTAQMQAMAFRALTSGGSCRVIVTPGSATPKSPAGKTQEILEYFKMGLFDPQNPGAKIALQLLSLPKSDEVVEQIERALADLEAKAQAAQQRQAMEQQQLQAQAAQHQQAMQAQVAQQQQQAQAQAAQQRAILQQHQAELSADPRP